MDNFPAWCSALKR